MQKNSDEQEPHEKKEIHENDEMQESRDIREDGDELDLQLRKRLHSRSLPPMRASVYENFMETCWKAEKAQVLSQKTKNSQNLPKRFRFFTWRKAAAIFLVIAISLGIAGRHKQKEMRLQNTQKLSLPEEVEEAELPGFLAEVAHDMIRDPSFSIVSNLSFQDGFWNSSTVREFLPEDTEKQTSKTKNIEEYWNETTDKVRHFLHRNVDGSRH